MAQVLAKGTAWERSLEDYAYTRALSTAGWAWEFLRHNEAYQRDVRLNTAGRPFALKHVSGALVFRLRRKFLAAEKWGLKAFSDPAKSALETTAFWLPELITLVAFCEVSTANDNEEQALSLASFSGRRVVLVDTTSEYLEVSYGRRKANLFFTGGSFLIGKSQLKFYHDGLKSASCHFETLKTLSQLLAANTGQAPALEASDSKYRDYLIALDGRLAGRSYRDIAEAIYGAYRVGATWTDDTQGLKSRVRRAVECGLALMNGGYRELL